jgi:hypothetical protein
MKNIVSLFLLLCASTTYGQHYYSDIIAIQELGNRMKTYVANKVQTISATGFDDRGNKASDFNEWQEVNADKKILKITTRNGQTVSRQLYKFDDQYRLINITDSSGTFKSTIRYTYSDNNQLSEMSTGMADSLTTFSEIEQHQWIYTSAGKPEKMRRIVNGTDTTEYQFSADEKGNVADEQLFRRDKGLDQVLFYYDDTNRLSDIVRYNKKLKQLLPDIMFEYDENNRVIQKMTIVSPTTRDYLIWRYIYNDKGLKTKEALFNKQKELTGRIEYAYSFLP